MANFIPADLSRLNWLLKEHAQKVCLAGALAVAALLEFGNAPLCRAQSQTSPKPSFPF